jgi:dTDP-4-dehydrorhamnose 3,5-epimerase
MAIMSAMAATPNQAGSSTIDGVQVLPLRRIPDERGTIYHMLRRTDEHFIEFGEIYFTTIYRGVVKGWHRHRQMTLNYACIAGRVKLVLYDDRPDSPTRGTLMECFLGPDDYSLVVIPPGIWTGFKGMTDEAIVANCATHPHDPSNTERIDPFGDAIPYDWGVRNH